MGQLPTSPTILLSTSEAAVEFTEKDQSPSTPIQRKNMSAPAKFNNLTKRWIRNCVNLIDLHRLNARLLPVIPDLEQEIREAHAQGLIYMENELRQTLEEEVKKTALIDRMNDMDKLIQEAKRKDIIEKRFVPTPEQVARGVICEAKEKENEILLEELDNLKNENKQMMESLSKLKIELSSKRTNIIKDIEKFKRATNIANTRIIVEELISIMSQLDLLK